MTSGSDRATAPTPAKLTAAMLMKSRRRMRLWSAPRPAQPWICFLRGHDNLCDRLFANPGRGMTRIPRRQAERMIAAPDSGPFIAPQGSIGRSRPAKRPALHLDHWRDRRRAASLCPHASHSTTNNRPPATGSSRCATRICAAFEAIEREAGSDAAFDYHRLGPRGRRRRRRRRRRARADEGQGVREGRGQRLDRRRRLLARNSPSRSTAPRTIRASSPPASAWSRTWPTRMSPRCT